MSAQHPALLYIGNQEHGQTLHNIVAPADWFVHQPECEEEALAFYIFYMPDAIIIDTNSDMPPETLESIVMHLQSVDAQPILVLSDKQPEWQLEKPFQVTYLPQQSTPQLIIHNISEAIFAQTGQCPEPVAIPKPDPCQ